MTPWFAAGIVQPVKSAHTQKKSRIEMRLDDIQLDQLLIERCNPDQLFATATERPAMETHLP